jgi:diacylglycerol kinase family enzyme
VCDHEPHAGTADAAALLEAIQRLGEITLRTIERKGDGQFDVVIVPVASMAQLAVLVPQILLGNHLDSPLLTFRRARKLAVESHPGMWFSVDGELVGNQLALFEVLPRALRVIIGSDGASQSDI